MTILRYLSREVLTHLTAVSFILLIIIFSGRFVKYLAEAATGDIAADILLPVMFYRLPGFLELIIPLALFIGILMSYGRLYVDSEMVVLLACGVSPARLAAYTLVPATFVMLIVGGLSLYVSPMGAARSDALLSDPSSSQGVSALVAGRFQSRDRGKIVSYTESISSDTQVMHTVFVATSKAQKGASPRLIVTVAQEGEMVTHPDTGARYMELRNGFRYDGVPGDLDYKVVSFERFGQLIAEPSGGIRSAAEVDGRPTVFLLKSNAPEDVAALHWRLSLPLMIPIVAIIALCLSRTDHRRGRYATTVPGFVIYLCYLMLLANGRAAIEKGTATPLGGIWWVHLLFLCIAMLMLFGPDFYRRLTYREHDNAHS